MALDEIEVVQTKRDNKVILYLTDATSDFAAELVAAIELVCQSRRIYPVINRRESIVVKEDRKLKVIDKNGDVI